MTRAFVAVRLPEVVLDAIAIRVAGVTIPGRRTAPAQWHLTLQFLGDDADVGAVAAALEGLDAETGAARVGGAGVFSDSGRGQVLWLGLAAGADVVERIADAVILRTGPLGYERDPRPFRPHITLARCRQPTDLRDVVDLLGAEPVGPAWSVDAVTLYESRLRSAGPEYVERATIPIATRSS